MRRLASGLGIVHDGSCRSPLCGSARDGPAIRKESNHVEWTRHSRRNRACVELRAVPGSATAAKRRPAAALGHGGRHAGPAGRLLVVEPGFFLDGKLGRHSPQSLRQSAGPESDPGRTRQRTAGRNRKPETPHPKRRKPVDPGGRGSGPARRPRQGRPAQTCQFETPARRARSRSPAMAAMQCRPN